MYDVALYENNSRSRKQNQHSTTQYASETPACYTVTSLVSLMFYGKTGLPVPSWISPLDLDLNATHQWPNHRDQVLEFRPCVDQHREKWFEVPLNCVTHMSVSCTPSLQEQMYGFQMWTMFRLRTILKLQDLPQSQSPETVPDDNVELYFTRDILLVFTRREMNVWDQTC